MIRKGQLNVTLSAAEFKKRFLEQFYDPSFSGVDDELAKVMELAWLNYIEYHKSPRKRPAGPDFKNSDFELPVEWLQTRSNLLAAEKAWKDSSRPSRVLVVCASPRNDQTCPGEMSKTYRLAKIAEIRVQSFAFETQFLDLRRLTSEYGKNLHPCKACVSTAMPLCHWPCSCYPNHAMGQTQDWMAEIYEMWVRAHGVMIVSPVHWYQAPSVLKLMMDRLVCADGGNPDPTSTQGKNPKIAKELELRGWDYPKHLAGRAFSVVVHGDAAGDENLRRSLVDWLHDMGLIDAGPLAQLNRYVGYYAPYATSHEELDRDLCVQEEVRTAADALVAQVNLIRSGQYRAPEEGLKPPRTK